MISSEKTRIQSTVAPAISLLFFFLTLDTGPKMPLSLWASDIRDYKTYIQAHLGSIAIGHPLFVGDMTRQVVRLCARKVASLNRT